MHSQKDHEKLTRRAVTPVIHWLLTKIVNRKCHEEFVRISDDINLEERFMNDQEQRQATDRSNCNRK